VSGRGFGEAVVEALRSKPEITSVDVENGRLQLGLVRGADLAAIVSLIVSSGGLVEEVRRDKASLEDVFLTLMEEEQ
jgi:ABC-2 type transport system ATP-binding protein